MKKLLKILIFIIVIFMGYLSYYKFIQTNEENKEKISTFLSGIKSKTKNAVNETKEKTEKGLDDIKKEKIKDSARVRSVFESSVKTTLSTLENEYHASLLIDNGFGTSGDCGDYATNKHNYKTCTYEVENDTVIIHVVGTGNYEGFVANGKRSDLKVEYIEE